MHPLFDDPFHLTKRHGNRSGSRVYLPLGHTTIRAIFNWVGHCDEIAIISHTETAETMAMTPSSVFGSLPPKNCQYEPLIAATHYIDPCPGPGGSPAALVARNTANGADMASVHGERDGRNTPIVATVGSLHGHHQPHPSTPRSQTVIREGGVAARTSHGAGLTSVRPIFGRNEGVGVPASGGLGGSASPN